jgi:hypothetical protein
MAFSGVPMTLHVDTSQADAAVAKVCAEEERVDGELRLPHSLNVDTARAEQAITSIMGWGSEGGLLGRLKSGFQSAVSGIGGILGSL